MFLGLSWSFFTIYLTYPQKVGWSLIFEFQFGLLFFDILLFVLMQCMALPCCRALAWSKIHNNKMLKKKVKFKVKYHCWTNFLWISYIVKSFYKKPANKRYFINVYCSNSLVNFSTEIHEWVIVLTTYSSWILKFLLLVRGGDFYILLFYAFSFSHNSFFKKIWTEKLLKSIIWSNSIAGWWM